MSKSHTKIDPAVDFPHMLPLGEAFKFTSEEREQAHAQFTAFMMKPFLDGFGECKKIARAYPSWLQVAHLKCILQIKDGHRIKEDAIEIVSYGLGKVVCHDLKHAILHGDTRTDPTLNAHPRRKVCSYFDGLAARAETEGDVVDMCGVPISKASEDPERVRFRINDTEVVELKRGAAHLWFGYDQHDMVQVDFMSAVRKAPIAVVRFSCALSVDEDAALKFYTNAPMRMGRFSAPYNTTSELCGMLTDEEICSAQED